VEGRTFFSIEDGLIPAHLGERLCSWIPNEVCSVVELVSYVGAAQEVVQQGDHWDFMVITKISPPKLHTNSGEGDTGVCHKAACAHQIFLALSQPQI
jgi:hypothetical protein